jgi:hypothetical protein
MTTAVDLSEKELSELKALTNETDAAAALRVAVAEYIRYAKRMRLKELSDQVEMEDNWREMEVAEAPAEPQGDELDRWYEELDAACSQMNPDDSETLMKATQEVRQQEKELARKRMGTGLDRCGLE